MTVPLHFRRNSLFPPQLIFVSAQWSVCDAYLSRRLCIIQCRRRRRTTPPVPAYEYLHYSNTSRRHTVQRTSELALANQQHKPGLNYRDISPIPSPPRPRLLLLKPHLLAKRTERAVLGTTFSVVAIVPLVPRPDSQRRNLHDSARHGSSAPGEPPRRRARRPRIRLGTGGGGYRVGQVFVFSVFVVACGNHENKKSRLFQIFYYFREMAVTFSIKSNLCQHRHGGG